VDASNLARELIVRQQIVLVWDAAHARQSSRRDREDRTTLRPSANEEGGFSTKPPSGDFRVGCG
jgi:hypothetical protein